MNDDKIVSDFYLNALPLYEACAKQTAHTFLRQVACILDDLSFQGLRLYVDEKGLWYWCWRETELNSPTSFWAMSETVVDAVIV